MQVPTVLVEKVVEPLAVGLLVKDSALGHFIPRFAINLGDLLGVACGHMTFDLPPLVLGLEAFFFLGAVTPLLAEDASLGVEVVTLDPVLLLGL